VLAAIAAKDADAAFRRMQRHVGAYSSLVKTLAEDEGKTAPKKPARRKR
jgi:DNA-binding GntR family transcriptional regulator